jgi:D-alanyl-lipoteichoic acid acyltransferase DltB (MBOAT superfamily)
MCWSVGYVLLILTSTLITWYCALQMAKIPTAASGISGHGPSDKERSQNRDSDKKKVFLIISLIANLGALFFFKYYNFFTTSLFEVSARFNLFQGHDAPLLHLMMPVGISFYTFQIVSYTIDVYRGKIPAEKHFGIFALYVAFWPRLVAGPIERAGSLIPQLRKRCSFDYTKATDGLRQVLWGMIKKVVIADQLAIYVNQVFDHCGEYSGAPLIIASIFFTIQIYCDFSGYSDMAIGTAKVMGYELTENFRHPYFAASLREFWQRWHISLSTWFRDYLYIPMGGNRVKRWRFHYNLLITFLVSGLWHGASWNFVIWGGLHGLYLIVENILEGFFKRVSGRFSNNETALSSDRSGSAITPSGTSVSGSIVSGNAISNALVYRGLRIAATLFLVNYAWIFFRANTLADAFSITGRMFLTGEKNPAAPVVAPAALILDSVLILFLFSVEIGEQFVRIDHFWKTLPLAARWSVYILGFWAIAISTVFGVKQDFIYFQF